MKKTLAKFVSERKHLSAKQVFDAARAAGFKTNIDSIYQARVRAKKKAPKLQMIAAAAADAPRASRLPKIAVSILYDVQLHDAEKVAMLKAYGGTA